MGMGMCSYFHRTWRPGYNSDFIDPNLAYSYQKKLDLAKKVAWWIFVLTLIGCVILLLVKVATCGCSTEPGNNSSDIINGSMVADASILSPRYSSGSGISRCTNNGTDTDLPRCPCLSDSFVCDLKSPDPKECIHRQMVCDGVQDCSNGLDEEACVTLSTSLDYVESNRTGNFLEGYVLVRVKGSWHPSCQHKWTMDMAEDICKSMGYPVHIDLDIHELANITPSGFHSESSDIDDAEDTGENRLDTRRKLWVLHAVSAKDVGPLELDIYETTLESDYDCKVAFIKCAMF